VAHDGDESTDAFALLSFASYGGTAQATRPMDIAARLICIGGPDLGASFHLGSGINVIGRGPVAVRLTGSEVSRQHARVTFESDSFVIEDLGSRNRTTVNGTPVTARTPIAYGDRIQIGSTILVLAHHDELEMRVQQLLRLDAMTAAVSGMAHDFNNAIQVLAAGIEEVAAELSPTSKTGPELIADMKVAAAAAMSLARRLVNLGRTGPIPTDVFELQPIVEEAAAMTIRLADPRRFEITYAVEPQMRVRGSRDELQQVLLNLCINARDAMAGGGSIRIEAHARQIDRASAVALVLPSEGSYVELSVRDTGTGMDEATLTRIFEPFFTTKEPGAGTGLGLAMTHVIVKRHGGTVLVESKLGEGTTFRILLPLTR
jgi:signal transduction histidine kinase